MLPKILGCCLAQDLGQSHCVRPIPSNLQGVGKVKLWPHSTLTVGKWLCIFYFPLAHVSPRQTLLPGWSFKLTGARPCPGLCACARLHILLSTVSYLSLQNYLIVFFWLIFL